MVNSFVLASTLPQILSLEDSDEPVCVYWIRFMPFLNAWNTPPPGHLLHDYRSIPNIALPITLLDTLLSARRQSFHDTMMISIAHTMNYLFIHQKDFISFLISIQTLYQVWLDLLMMFCLPFSEVGNCFLPLDLIGAWLDGV